MNLGGQWQNNSSCFLPNLSQLSPRLQTSLEARTRAALSPAGKPSLVGCRARASNGGRLPDPSMDRGDSRLKYREPTGLEARKTEAKVHRRQAPGFRWVPVSELAASWKIRAMTRSGSAESRTCGGRQERGEQRRPNRQVHSEGSNQ